MGTYYSQVEDAIKKNESELEHLQDELRMLRSVEKDTPRESYQRQLERIEYHIEQQTKYLEQNRSLIDNYKTTYDGIIALRNLRNLYDNESDSLIRSEIKEKISARSNEVSTSMKNLTDELLKELADELDEFRSSIFDASKGDKQIIEDNDSNSLKVGIPEVIVPMPDDGKQTNNTNASVSDDEKETINVEDSIVDDTKEFGHEALDDRSFQEGYQLLKTELEHAERDYQASRVEMQRIFDEERDRKLNGDLFTTVEELDAFYDRYMQMKIKENARQLDALRRIEEAREKLDAMEKQMAKNSNVNDTDNEPRKVKKPDQPINYIPGKPPIGIPILSRDDKNKDGVLGISGPTLDNDTPTGPTSPTSGNDTSAGMPSGDGAPTGATEPTSGNDVTPRITGPTIDDRPLGLPGPTIGDTPRLPGPVKGEKTSVESERKPGKRDLIDILDDIVDGLEIEHKEGKRYRASNIKVMEEFKQELSSGNYLYNIVHFLPAVVKLPFKLLSKTAAKLMTTDNAKHNVEVIKDRLKKLPPEDLMTIYTEYRAGQFGNMGLPSLVNILIDERMQHFALEKVTEINSNIEKQYIEVFDAIKTLDMIDAALKTKRSEKDIENLKKYRTHILKGQAKKIEAIRNNYKQANGWLSGGVHGFSEDVKASMSKLSYVGMRFAKEHDLDGKLLKQQREYKDAENEAIANNDDEKALRSFVKHETLLSDNTKISNSIFGKQSTGKRYYNPLAVQLDYRDDPFVRDLFTSIVIASSAISAVNAVKSHAEAERIFQEQKDAITKDEQIIGQARQAGQDIVDKRGTMMEGMGAQANQDILNVEGQIERAVLDKHGWKFTNAYHVDDKAGHTFFNDFYSNTQQSLQDIAAKYSSGTITQHQAMEMLKDVSNGTQDVLSTVSQECSKILKPYAASHPQFDLSAAEGAMDFIVQNPSAISEMNKAIVDIDSIGEALSGLTPAQVSAYNSLPSDLQTTLFAAASATALAANVSTTMTNNIKKGKYGNEVTDMVSQYAEQQAQAQEQSSDSKGK